LELQFNPNKFWTVKLTGNQQVAIDSGISVYLKQYVDQRLPFWTTVKDPTGALWWTTPQGSGGQPANYFATNVNSSADRCTRLQGLKKPQTSEYAFSVISSYRSPVCPICSVSVSAFLKSVSAGGAYRWQSASSDWLLWFGSGSRHGCHHERSIGPNRFTARPKAPDLNFSYRTKLFRDRIGTTFQLNVKDATENGHLKGLTLIPTEDIGITGSSIPAVHPHRHDGSIMVQRHT